MADRTPDGTPTVKLGATPASASASEPTETSAFDPPAQRFDTVGEIGRGGMGRVDDAHDKALDRPVAIKHLLSTSPVDLARFEREARITARLEHPGIVPIHDAGRTAEGTPYYVMRRVDGQPLDQRVTLVLAERLVLIPNVLAACDAVAFAHSRGIVHRDIKPTNILVGPFGETLVIDWGLARQIDETDSSTAVPPSADHNLTRAGTVAGTPGFMAPEQARGEAVDARADVFALGSTLFYVLAGGLPYGVESATEMIGLVGAGRSADWSKMPAQVPPELVAIAKKAMAAEASDRYSDAGALAADLRRFITGNLVGAYEYSAGAKLARFLRRHRGAVAVALIALAVVGFGAVLSVRRVLAERDSANHERELAEQRRREVQSGADLLRIKHALELADNDPVGAIAVLRSLPKDSPRWPEARVAAQSAYLKGIPFGYAGMRGAQVIAINRDNRHLLAASWNGGQMIVIDLIAHTKTMLKIELDTRGFAWLGPDHVAIGRKGRIDVLELRTGHIRMIDVDVSSMLSDHGDKLWVTTPDKRLIEIVGAEGEPHELARDVLDLSQDADLSEAVITHTGFAELWTPTHRIRFVEVPEKKFLPIFQIGGNRISMIRDTKLHLWHIAGERIVDDGEVSDKRFFLQALAVNDMYLTSSKDGFGTIVNGDYHNQSRDLGNCFPTPSGAVLIGQDGSLRVFDTRGQFLLGRRSAGLRRADVSSDSRFVVALTTTGDILAWDLKDLRPATLHTSAAMNFAAITDHYVWLTHTSNGISRLDLATMKIERMIDHIITDEVVIDLNERWVAFGSLGELVITDFVNHRTVTAKPFAFNLYDDGVIALELDGEISSWHVGDDRLQPRARIRGSDPIAITAGGNIVLVRFADHIERFDLASNTMTTANLEIVGFGVQHDGRAWISTDSKVYRWDGGAPVPFEVPVVATTTVLRGDQVVFYTPDSVTYVRNGISTTTALASKDFSWSGSRALATLSVQGVPSIVDLETGLAFTIPAHADRIANIGDLLVDGFAEDLEVWRFAVPTKPAELQAWLDHVTNAVSIPGSEAYTWP